VDGVLPELILFREWKETIPRAKKQKLITDYLVRMLHKKKFFYGPIFLISLYHVDHEERSNP